MIKLNGNFYIEICDTKCLALVYKSKITKGKNAGKTKSEIVGYYGNLQALLRGYLNKKVLVEPVTSIKALVKAVNEAEQAIRDIDGKTYAEFKKLWEEHS